MIQYREINAVDIQGVIQCIHSASIANKRDYPDDFIDMLNDKHYTQDWLSNKISQENLILVAEDQVKGKIVGVISHNQNEITNVFVDLAYQGEKIGKTLMNRMENHLKRKGYTKLVLSANLTSINFYENMGYQIITRNKEEISSHEIISFRCEKLV